MINTHEQEKKQFIRLFQEQGLDRFDERFQVLEAFLHLDHHVTQADIVQQLKKEGKKLTDEFVFSSMEHLCRFGFATKVEFDREETLYEHRHLGIHHDHMICTKCGTILEFKDEALEKQQQKIAQAYGFHMLQHRMEIYGFCAACMAKRQKLVLLHKAKQGERLTVKELEAGRKMQLRISSMGLKIGDEIEVVSNGFGGQVVIASGETRLVIGSGMAQKIWVQPVGSVMDLQKNAKDGTVTDPQAVRLLLCDMKAGQEGTIVRVSGESALRRRLLEMGINRGTRVYVEKYAPLKDPIELVVKGYHISLRVEEAAQILVENVTNRKR
ncbi:MAG: FeoA domain-containing protein [Desulfotignum sp.]|nr:FeoA domain-containing protein [Desulfotignum sp.]MCF8112453.1 FeoA domain-containing protein [Desulfotignum sp.]MCF8124828.1 FeoA domain-containing protein [Desulfotignum sp.]